MPYSKSKFSNIHYINPAIILALLDKRICITSEDLCYSLCHSPNAMHTVDIGQCLCCFATGSPRMLRTKILPPLSSSLELAASTLSVLLPNVCFFTTAAFVCFFTSVASEISLYSSGSETSLTGTRHSLPFIALRVVQVVRVMR